MLIYHTLTDTSSSSSQDVIVLLENEWASDGREWYWHAIFNFRALGHIFKSLWLKFLKHCSVNVRVTTMAKSMYFCYNQCSDAYLKACTIFYIIYIPCNLFYTGIQQSSSILGCISLWMYFSTSCIFKSIHSCISACTIVTLAMVPHA